MKPYSISFRIITCVVIALLIQIQFCIIPATGNEHYTQPIPGNINPYEVIDSNPTPSPCQGADPNVTWSLLASPNATLIYNAIELGDINNDGNLDVASAYDGQGLKLWLGDGNGNLQTAIPPTTLGNYNDIQIGDINNDGKPDIVSTKQGGISAWYGNGTGSDWSADVAPAATGTFNALHLNDVNLDGNLDIIAAATGTVPRKGVQVFLGNGHGGWSNGDANLPVNLKFNGVFTADFNNDGKADIAAAGDAGVDAWTGNGAGTWTLADSGLPSSGAFSDVELSDLDHDGDLDLIATGSNNNGLRIWKGNGAGLWDLTYTLPTTGTYTALEISDVNIDGYMDIIAASSNTNQVVWTGDGAFNWYQQNTGLPSGSSFSDLSLGDANNDGHPDICIANANAGIEIWKSSSQRTVNKWTVFPSPNTAISVNDIEVCDINMDGKLDICYATQSNGIQIWTGNGAGTWATFTSPISTGTVYAISCLDYNDDGKPDIIATQNTGIRAWTGNGQGTWTQTTSGLPSSGTWYGLAAADFNDDGKMDIVSGSGTNGGLYVWNGNGAGIWTRTYTLPLTGTYYDIRTADFNLDGSLDIITATGGLRVFLGNSNDGWTESSAGLPDGTSQYKYVAAADLNHNGKMDFAAASLAAGANAWHGNGNGQWNLDSNIIPTHGSGIAVADFSIDGAMDVAVGSESGSGVCALQKGTNGWNNQSDGLATTGNFGFVIFADVNIDGRQDIISYNNTAQSSRIWVGDYEAPALDSFMIGPLSVGWNLVSIPLVPANTTMPGVLADLDADTSWTSAKCYDAEDTSDPWKSYSYGRPAIFQDLAAADETDGIWVFIPNITCLGDGYIRVQGYEPGTTGIFLKYGWNLVGYPSAQTRTASGSLPATVDMVSVYQATAPYVQDITSLSSVNLEPGNGYWVHATSDCTWNLDY